MVFIFVASCEGKPLLEGFPGDSVLESLEENDKSPNLLTIVSRVNVESHASDGRKAVNERVYGFIFIVIATASVNICKF